MDRSQEHDVTGTVNDFKILVARVAKANTIYV